MARAPLYAWQLETMNDKDKPTESPEHKLKKFLNKYDTPEKISEANIDNDMLFEIVNADYNWLPYYMDDLRAAAIEKIDAKGNEDFFIDIIKKSGHQGMCNEAIKKIECTSETEELFIKLAGNGVDEAINRLSEDTLAKIVGDKEINDCIIDYGYTKTIIDDTDSRICNKILEHISDENIIKDLGINYPTKDPVANFVIRKTSNQEALTEIAIHNNDKEICLRALKKISDMDALCEISISANKREINFEALKKISDEYLLIQIAENSKFYDIRAAAIDKISDKNVLKRISMEDTSKYVRISAEERINKIDAPLKDTEQSSNILNIHHLDKKHKIIVKQIQKQFPIIFSCIKDNTAIFETDLSSLGEEYTYLLPTNAEVMSGDAIDPYTAWIDMVDKINNEVKEYWPINSKYDIYVNVDDDE